MSGWPVKDTGIRVPVSAEVLAEADEWRRLWAEGFAAVQAELDWAHWRSEAAKLEAFARGEGLAP